MNRVHFAVMQNKSPIIKVGPRASADPPSIENRGGYFIQTDDSSYPNGRRWKYRHVFKNGGADRISLGKPTALVNLLSLASDYIVVGVYNTNPSVIGSVVCLSGGSGFEQMNMVHFGADYVACRVGGLTAQKTVAALNSVWNKTTITKTGSVFFASNNGVNTTTAPCGTETSVNDITIGGRVDGTVNFEGNTSEVLFYTSAGVLVDKVDFDDDSRWDGGLTGTTWAGNPFTVTAMAPSPERVVDLVPDQW